MAEKVKTRNCYCAANLEEHPQYLKDEEIPFGFCGTCEFCGDLGHTRHYPGPVPCTGSWCDVCYKVEAHFAPDRKTGVWSFDSENDKELEFNTAESFDFNFLSQLLLSLRTPKSALVINHPSKLSIDFRVKPKGFYDFYFSDYEKAYFVNGDVDFDSAEKVLQIALQNENLKDAFDKLGFDFKYYKD